MWAPLFALCLAMCHIAGLSAEIFIGPNHYELHTTYPNSQYRFYTDRKNWYDAVLDCFEKGSHLVVIDSEEEAEVIRTMIRRASAPYTWVGIRDDLSEGVWRTDPWLQLVSESGYDKWTPGEPNGGENENCGFVYPDALYRDLPCSQPAPYICERPDKN